MSSTNEMPALFIGHGSPMNIIQDNEFTNDLKKLGNSLPTPEAILVISAHWLTNGTYVTCEAQPRQIYDYYGFPKELYEFKYHPQGKPELAKQITQLGTDKEIQCSTEWGIDHAAYMVLGHIFPDANIPTLELSLDYYKPPEFHYDLARILNPLRKQGVLIIGSGNMIHTFRFIDYNQYVKPYQWALDFDLTLKNDILKRNHEKLIHYEGYPLSSKAFQTNEHYLPMLYILSLQEKDEAFKFIHEGFQHGSISHRSFQIG